MAAFVAKQMVGNKLSAVKGKLTKYFVVETLPVRTLIISKLNIFSLL